MLSVPITPLTPRPAGIHLRRGATDVTQAPAVTSQHPASKERHPSEGRRARQPGRSRRAAPRAAGRPAPARSLTQIAACRAYQRYRKSRRTAQRLMRKRCPSELPCCLRCFWMCGNVEGGKVFPVVKLRGRSILVK